MYILTKTIYRFNEIFMKIQMTFLIEIQKKKQTLEFVLNQKAPEQITILKKEASGCITLSDFKVYYKAIVIKTV